VAADPCRHTFAIPSSGAAIVLGQRLHWVNAYHGSPPTMGTPARGDSKSQRAERAGMRPEMGNYHPRPSAAFYARRGPSCMGLIGINRLIGLVSAFAVCTANRAA
jgi:hypothetical protein